MLQDLLGNLHSRFDKDPEKALALRIRHPDGFAWSILNRTLIAATERGQPIATIALEGKEIGAVADLLSQAGCTVEYLSEDLRHRSAAILIDGAGTETSHNGDHLYGYTSLLWAILDAASLELEETERMAIVTALRQAYMHTAGGEWLEGWGGFFAVPRRDGELDPSYLAHIVRETLRPRVNGLAIEDAIEENTGHVVDLDEPWQRVHRLSVSPMSGDHHLHDGHHFTWNVIRPVSREVTSPQTWNEILKVIFRNKPIGTLIDEPEWIPPVSSVLYDYHGTASVSGDMLSVFSAWANIIREMVLDDNLAMSDSSVPTLNYGAAIYAFLSLESDNPLAPLQHENDTYLTEVPYGSICLSDGLAIGDGNALLGSWVETWEEIGGRVMSDNYALSDIGVVHTVARRDRLIYESNGIGIDLGLSCPSDLSGTYLMSSTAGTVQRGTLGDVRLSDTEALTANHTASGIYTLAGYAALGGIAGDVRRDYWISGLITSGDEVTMTAYVPIIAMPWIMDGIVSTGSPVIPDFYPFRVWDGEWTGTWAGVQASVAMATW